MTENPTSGLVSLIASFEQWLLSANFSELSLFALCIVLFIIFLLKDKPVTSLIKWLQKTMASFSKFFSTRISKWLTEDGGMLAPMLGGMNLLFKKIKKTSTSHKTNYDVPLYLALADEKTNVRAIMHSAGRKALDDLSLEDEQTELEKDWYFFDEATVVTFSNFDKMTKELLFYRPERPLDGVILCVSIDNFIGQPTDQVSKLAEQQFKLLWRLQKEIQFVLPVYLLITDCDKLIGFRPLFDAESVITHHKEILGWSNPNDENKVYRHDWIDEGIDAVEASLRKVQLNAVHGDDHESSLDMLLFQARLREAKAAIKLFCEKLFTSSKFYQPHLFRGFYFSGDIAEQNGEQKASEQHIFLKHLFSDRIFAEANLAYALQAKVFSNDKLFKRIQQLLIILVFSSTFLLTQDLINVKKQSDNLVNLIIRMPERPAKDEYNTDEGNIKYVNRVLEHMAKMDASSMSHWLIPASYPLVTKIDNDLENYFANSVFRQEIFPAFECQAQYQINNQINAESTTHYDYINWLQNVADALKVRSNLRYLMVNEFGKATQVEQLFTQLVSELYSKKLPSSFYRRSDIYFEAIKSEVYTPQLLNESAQRSLFCSGDKARYVNIWQAIGNKTAGFFANIDKQLSPPQGFLDQLASIQSSGVSEADLSKIEDFVHAFEQYNVWYINWQQNWANAPIVSTETTSVPSCDTAVKLLNLINNSTDTPVSDLSFEYGGQEFNNLKQIKSECMALYAEYSKPSLADIQYPVTDKQFHLAMQSLTSKTFANISGDSHSSDIGEAVKDQSQTYFWSIEQLNNALGFYHEQQSFVQEYLPVTEQSGVDNNTDLLIRDVSQRLLYIAMDNAIEDARQPKSIDYKDQANYLLFNDAEVAVQHRIDNFNQAKSVLLDISRAFDTLGFDSAKVDLLKTLQEYAYSLLKQVDELYQQSHLYKPLETKLWGAQQYINALFGITSEGQLKDYLTAQGARVEYISTQYVAPLLVFLQSTSYQHDEYDLFSKWQNTIVEINKRNENQNTANSMQVLEDFVLNQLATTDQSNCFDKSKAYVLPAQNDLFAISQRDIIKQAKSLCHSFTAQQIVKEYNQLKNDFTELLANKFPFSSDDSAKPLELTAIRSFLDKYPGKSTGLAKRMGVLKYTKRNDDNVAQYATAEEKIEQLDSALAFFESVLGATADTSSPGVEIAVELDVLQRQSSQVNQIANWRFTAGDSSVNYPASMGVANTSLYWLPDDNTEFVLEWADSSPYNAEASKGTTSGNYLIYASEGVWSLLAFINQHRSSLPDTNTRNPASILLNFGAELFQKSSDSSQHKPASKTGDALALARVTLYGMNPETKAKQVINLPDRFLTHIPPIVESKQSGASHASDDE